MAKGQMRSTREAKKPKATKKPETATPASNFLKPPAKPAGNKS